MRVCEVFGEVYKSIQAFDPKKMSLAEIGCWYDREQGICITAAYYATEQLIKLSWVIPFEC